MLVIIDNYDSFVLNIARCFRMLGATVEVVRNDQVGVDALVQLKPRGIVISPGPRTPAEAGVSLTVVRALSGHLPIFGICLGHQCIGRVFGGRIVAARRPLHGQASPVMHNGGYLFAGLPSPLLVGLYHSLAVELEESFSSPLVVTARSEEGEIMAVAHRSAPTYGVQFHPESILTQYGDVLLANSCILLTSGTENVWCAPTPRLPTRVGHRRMETTRCSTVDWCDGTPTRISLGSSGGCRTLWNG